MIPFSHGIGAIVEEASEKGLTLSIAESCTGGILSDLVTDVPGASACFKGGVVAYSNEAKVGLLGVDPLTLGEHGAVSRETAIEMAQGCMDAFGSDISLALTGIAGPSGGTPAKPVGTLYIALAVEGKDAICEGFSLGDVGRREFKLRAAEKAMGLLAGAVTSSRDPRDGTHL